MPNQLAKLIKFLTLPWTYVNYCLVGTLIFLSAYTLSEKAVMSDNWTGPYLSAAANLEWGGEFLIDLDEVKTFKNLEQDQQFNYKWATSTSLVHYNHNPIGYAYLIRIAKTVFPVGDMRSIIWLQILVHIVMCLSILVSLGTPIKKYLFTFLYCLNPIVLYVVGINFYYFWQAVPSSVLLLVYLNHWQSNRDRTQKPWLIAGTFCFLGIAVGLAFVSRPTIIGYLIVGGIMLFPAKTRLVCLFPMLVAFMFIVLSTWQPTEKNFWHTAYIGLGAYPNKHVKFLSDNEGYELFEKTTGKILGVSVGGSYYETDTIRKYKAVTKERYFAIAKQTPLLIFKNASLNLLQGFAGGYFNKAPYFIHISMAFLGLLVLLLLLWFREFFVLISCLLGLAPFALYYPPIPAYMFGNYLLLAFGATSIATKILLDFRRPKTSK
ncbi:hypothetical protein N9066_00325 [bacterium]|nr:hypothetical protein [bacterium]